MRPIFYQGNQPTDKVVCAVVLRAIAQRRYEIFGFDEMTGIEVTSDEEIWPSLVASTSVMFLSDQCMPEYLIALDRFQKFAEQWRKSRNSISSSAWNHLLNPAYQRIVGMGPIVVPFILHELKRELGVGEPDDWFVALWVITGENPVPQESCGKIREMAEAWLKWGLQLGYINDEDLGGQIPAFGNLGMA